MLKITEEFVNSTAPNQNAIVNGWGLVKKNKFVRLEISEDETVIIGECKGSGSSNYITSADFIKPESPVFRCSCPSRQFPCKHSLGLMYALVNGKKFETGGIPEDVLKGRERAEKREEKKEKDASTPKKVNKSALTKKIKAQLEGLELLEKITLNIVQSGLGTITPKSLNLLDDQVKQLGNFYIPGGQNALRELIVLFKSCDDYEKIYTEAVDCLTRLYSMCKKGTQYLEKRLENPEVTPQEDLVMEEWLGRAWQLAELKEIGLCESNVELIQLSFYSYIDEARQEYVDRGLWLNLKSGQLQQTLNFRPFKAAKYIREDDSVFSIVQVNELFKYPGDMNPRVRWESMTLREIKNEDFAKVMSFAQSSFQEVIKSVKNQIKNPLSDKYPVLLLSYSKIAMVDGVYIVEDEKGNRLVLEDNPFGLEPASVDLLRLVKEECLEGKALLVRFHNNLDTRKLRLQPLSIITENNIIRLVY